MSALVNHYISATPRNVQSSPQSDQKSAVSDRPPRLSLWL